MESKLKKLPPAFKKKWVTALRSGKYKQGRERLYNPITNTYCCLGVACEITKAHPGTAAYIPYTKKYSKVPGILKGRKQLPELLADRNDAYRWSFMKIATWIENNL